MIWNPSAGLPHIKIVLGMALCLFLYGSEAGGALHWRLFPQPGQFPCQISAPADVMAITKWSIWGSEQSTIACHLPKPRPRVHGIISVRKDRELGLPLE